MKASAREPDITRITTTIMVTAKIIQLIKPVYDVPHVNGWV